MAWCLLTLQTLINLGATNFKPVQPGHRQTLLSGFTPTLKSAPTSASSPLSPGTDGTQGLSRPPSSVSHPPPVIPASTPPLFPDGWEPSPGSWGTACTTGTQHAQQEWGALRMQGAECEDSEGWVESEEGWVEAQAGAGAEQLPAMAHRSLVPNPPQSLGLHLQGSLPHHPIGPPYPLHPTSSHTLHTTSSHLPSPIHSPHSHPHLAPHPAHQGAALSLQSSTFQAAAKSTTARRDYAAPGSGAMARGQTASLKLNGNLTITPEGRCGTQK